MKKHIVLPLIATTLLGFGANSNAALVTQNFSGQFTFVDDAVVAATPSLSGISLAAPASGSITYEDSLVAAVGTSILDLGTFMQSLSLSFGALNFTEVNDIDYGLGFPSADFEDGALTGINFLHMNANGWDLEVMGTAFTIWDYSTPVDILVAEGNFSYAVVPVPAAAWLFGSGLLGLCVVARRNSRG